MQDATRCTVEGALLAGMGSAGLYWPPAGTAHKRRLSAQNRQGIVKVLRFSSSQLASSLFIARSCMITARVQKCDGLAD